jgi:hypothetical protein
MYAAKNEHASTVRALALRVHNGDLIELFGWESAARAEDPIEPHSASTLHLPSRFHWNPVADIKPRPRPTPA